jgi:hypothetical protein
MEVSTMAFEQPGFKITLPAGGDLSSSQYKFVKLNTSGQAVDIAAATDIPCGVLQNKPTSGQAAEIMVAGISKIQGDVNLAKADMIGCSSDGQASVVVAGTDTTKYVLGQVIDDNTVAAGLISALIQCYNPHRGA